jgi:hypothetical protein
VPIPSHVIPFGGSVGWRASTFANGRLVIRGFLFYVSVGVGGSQSVTSGWPNQVKGRAAIETLGSRGEWREHREAGAVRRLVLRGGNEAT